MKMEDVEADCDGDEEKVSSSMEITATPAAPIGRGAAIPRCGLAAGMTND